MRATGLGVYWSSAPRANTVHDQCAFRVIPYPENSFSPPANSVFTPLLEAKTERFAAHPSRVTHEIVCPGPPTRHSYPFKTHSFRAPTSGLAQRDFKQGCRPISYDALTPVRLGTLLKILCLMGSW